MPRSSAVPRSGRRASPPLIPAPRHHLPAAPPRHAVAVGAGLLLGSLLIGLLVSVGERPVFQGLDDGWAASMNGSRADALTGLATVFDRLGGPLGMVLPLGLIGCLCVYGRWRSGLFALTAGVMANVLLVLPLKQLVDRPRPPHPWVLVNDGSFPSGQVFSAVTLMFVAAVLVFPPRARRWWWLFAALYVVAMMGSRTWLHAQWLSDTVAGALAGAGSCMLLWRAFAPLLRIEAERVAADSLWL
ncbi:phosphatase PAP2 family protein [Streptomyces sp. NBC_01443]|uniref:phosphatase PAP2 family protein n=1 Tax=Streptomyces sp. NBC_01443 TaxID=2903868 RepID=UPI00224E358A|nr:phosphatase PAP2 family protein [Streptomyces sp. NBC_01443]MCX4631634.1 phosphatase PAP2 family protein [Streptomyces sp. NBC_01443]